MKFTVDGETFDIGEELGYTTAFKAVGNADAIAAEINTVMIDKGYDIEAFSAVSRFESNQTSPKTSLRFRVGDGLSFDMSVNHGHIVSSDDDKVGWSRQTSDNSSWWNGASDNYTQSFSVIGPGGARIDTIDGALDAIGQMDRTLNRYNQDMSTLGAKHNRLQSAARRLETDRSAVNAANSRIVDADFAFQTARLARSQILEEAANAVMAQTKNQSQSILRLI